MKLFTVGQLARSAKLSRTSLLHYERLGLLRPSSRSASGYRLYGQAQVQRLRAVRIYREAGVPLAEIRELLSCERNEAAAILERRLVELDRQVQQLRAQQRSLARLLAQPTLMVRGIRTKAQWVSMLGAAGFAPEEMLAWHRSFEADAPLEHQEFLSALGLARREIVRVRASARAPGEAPTGA
jgi:MerR family transcriptional regulator, thiopeptide resistance regulator